MTSLTRLGLLTICTGFGCSGISPEQRQDSGIGSTLRDLRPGALSEVMEGTVALGPAKLSTFSFPHRAVLDSGVRRGSNLYLAGYIDRIKPSREDAMIVRHDGGLKAESALEVDSGLPGFKPAWKPTSPAYFRPDRFYDITTTGEGSVIAVGSQYNVPSRWKTVSSHCSSDLLLVKLSNNKEVFRRRWKPSEVGYHDTIGLMVEPTASDGFVVIGATAKSKGPHVEPVIIRQTCFLNFYKPDGSMIMTRLFAENSVPLACSVSKDSKWCYVVTQDNPKVKAKVDTKIGSNLSLHKFDLNTGKTLSSETIFKTGPSELVSNVEVFENGRVYILSGKETLNDQGFGIWDGPAFLNIVDSATNQIRKRLPEAGRISVAWPFATTTKMGSALLIALKLNHVSGMTPSYGIYVARIDGVLTELGKVESNLLGGDPKRGRSGRCVSLMANETSVDMLVQVEWSKALTKYAVAEFPLLD